MATAVTVLNSLPINRPVDPKYKLYAYFTQDNYFSAAVSQLRTREDTLKRGMTLEMAAQAMRLSSTVTTPVHAEDTTPSMRFTGSPPVTSHAAEIF